MIMEDKIYSVAVNVLKSTSISFDAILLDGSDKAHFSLVKCTDDRKSIDSSYVLVVDNEKGRIGISAYIFSTVASIKSEKEEDGCHSYLCSTDFGDAEIIITAK